MNVVATASATPSPLCPDCGAALPVSRANSPWCECGWTSVTTEWLLRNVPPYWRRHLIRGSKTAKMLEKADQRAGHLIDHPLGKWLWRLYLGLTILLCLPVYAIKILLYLALAAGWVLAIKFQIPFFIVIMLLITVGLIVFRLITRPDKDTLGLTLKREDVPELYALLDEVAGCLSVKPMAEVRLQLYSIVAISQHNIWKSGLHSETQLDIGLLSLFALDMTQLKVVIAHELGHSRQKDPQALGFIFTALVSLQGWVMDAASIFNISVRGRLGSGVLIYPLYLLMSTYLRMLLWVCRWAIRRQEYSADRIAAQAFGKSTLLQALLSIGAISVAFDEYLPVIQQKISSGYNRRDYYQQFGEYWNQLDEASREAYYAKAVASLGTVYDTHPSYRARRMMLASMPDALVAESDSQPAISLLPNAFELGRQLTVQMIKHRKA